jgi:hypothetical protein
MPEEMKAIENYIALAELRKAQADKDRETRERKRQ